MYVQHAVRFAGARPATCPLPAHTSNGLCARARTQTDPSLTSSHGIPAHAWVQDATDQLQQQGQQQLPGSGGGDALAHPGLYPVLIILSRLSASHMRDDALHGDDAASASGRQGPAGSSTQAPTTASSSTAAAAPPAATSTTTALMVSLSPVAFAPLVRRCGGATPLAVRSLAARALVPLVAPEDVPAVLRQLLAAVPGAPGPGGAGVGSGGAVASSATWLPVGVSANALQVRGEEGAVGWGGDVKTGSGAHGGGGRVAGAAADLQCSMQAARHGAQQAGCVEDLQLSER